jgi:hypothetical protein
VVLLVKNYSWFDEYIPLFWEQFAPKMGCTQKYKEILDCKATNPLQGRRAKTRVSRGVEPIAREQDMAELLRLEEFLLYLCAV